MKRFVIIGLGNFGAFVARQLYELRHDVIALDKRPEVVDAIGPHVTHAVVGDASKKAVLEEIGAATADAAIISTGSELASSILALMAVRDIGIKEIYVKVRSDEQARIAEALGATESIFPEREAAHSLASRLTSGKLLQYVQLGEQFGLQEMAVPDAWSGKSLRTLGLPQRYQVQIVAIHDMLRDEIRIPDADRPLTPSDTLLVAGAPKALEELTKLH